MTDLRTAAQQALAFTMRDFASLRDFEAARAVLHDNLRAALAEPVEPRNQCGETCERAKLCATCAQALAQQAEPKGGGNLPPPLQAEPVQEPVAWYRPSTAPHYYAAVLVQGAQPPAPLTQAEAALLGWKPLYTAPPQRKPLTEEEVEQCFRAAGITIKGSRWTNAVRNVERAHGIGEQP